MSILGGYSSIITGYENKGNKKPQEAKKKNAEKLAFPHQSLTQNAI
jgi:hypothetical protein